MSNGHSRVESRPVCGKLIDSELFFFSGNELDRVPRERLSFDLQRCSDGYRRDSACALVTMYVRNIISFDNLFMLINISGAQVIVSCTCSGPTSAGYMVSRVCWQRRPSSTSKRVGLVARGRGSFAEFSEVKRVFSVACGDLPFTRIFSGGRT